MRLAIAFLLAAVPACALAQPQPSVHGAHSKPARHRAAAQHHGPVKRAPVKRAPVKPGPGKPGPGKPGPGKPGPAKPVQPKPPAPPPAAANPDKGGVTGLPVPRFASLKTDDVNFRRGPGTRYPIEWVYKRRGLPVEIEREFEVWRLVVDPQGTKGWVHTVTLTSRRTAVVTGAQRILRAAASDAGAPVAKLDTGVIVRLRRCAATSEWCEVEVGDYHGFLRRDEVWGVLPGETVP